MPKKTSSDLAEELAGLGEEIRQRAIAETRKDIAEEVAAHFLGGPRVARRTYGGTSPDDCIVEALADFETLRDPRLQSARDRFEEQGVSDDFRAGVLFAVRLFADPHYDY